MAAPTAQWVLLGLFSAAVPLAGLCDSTGPAFNAEQIARALSPESRGDRRSAPRIEIDVHFAFDSASLTLEARRQLDELGAALRSLESRGLHILVIGHTDATGPVGHNLELSRRRAASVRKYLVHHHGIPSGTVYTIGMGQGRLGNPFAPASPGNRRVEVVVGERLTDVLSGSIVFPEKAGRIKW